MVLRCLVLRRAALRCTVPCQGPCVVLRSPPRVKRLKAACAPLDRPRPSPLAACTPCDATPQVDTSTAASDTVLARRVVQDAQAAVGRLPHTFFSPILPPGYLSADQAEALKAVGSGSLAA